jgi:hypothetical protein
LIAAAEGAYQQLIAETSTTPNVSWPTTSPGYDGKVALATGFAALASGLGLFGSGCVHSSYVLLATCLT